MIRNVSADSEDSIHEGLGYVQKEETSYVNAACMDMILKSPRAPTQDVVPFIVDIKND